MTPRPTIAAIVWAYHEARFLGPCLHSLLAQTRPPDEFIVVDEASTDGTGAISAEHILMMPAMSWRAWDGWRRSHASCSR